MLFKTYATLYFHYKTRSVKKEEMMKEHKYNRENMYFVACLIDQQAKKCLLVDHW